MKKITALIIIVYLLTIKGAAQTNTDAAKGLQQISVSEMMKDIEFFASPQLEGRFPGSKGYDKAAGYSAAYFKNIGLAPYNRNSYIQPVPVEYNEFTGAVKLEKIQQGKAVKQFTHGSDFVCRGFSGTGNITVPVVFCGYGMTFPELGYDDYASADVKDKIVLVFKQNPSWANNIEGINMMLTRYKAGNAAKHGSKAILFVSTPNMANPQKPIGSIMDGTGEQQPDFPQIQISLELANELLMAPGKNLSSLQSWIDSLKKPVSVEISDTMHLQVNTKYEKEHFSKNIIAVLPGSDAKLKDEYLVIGAHLDHVGKQGNIFFPGANDNASGSAAVLQIARAFAIAGIKPKRSIIFVLFTSEEQGLNGSRFFTDNPPAPLEKIVAMFNLDCIGHGDSIQVGGGSTVPLLWHAARRQDSLHTRLMTAKTWPGGGSDAQPFFENGIPTLYFATKNSYTHLHLTTDTPPTLNTELLEKVTRLVFLTAFEIAGGNYSKELLVK